MVLREFPSNDPDGKNLRTGGITSIQWTSGFYMAVLNYKCMPMSDTLIPRLFS